MPATTMSAPAPSGAGAFSRPTSTRHLLGLEGISRPDLVEILDRAQRFRDLLDGPGIQSQELRGVTVCNAFFENSTRTRVSFELAEQRLGATHVSFSASDSSTAKGETLLDTLRVVQSMRVDLVVVRHPSAGVASYLARHLDSAGVVNAGDGAHEHPTQGLLDLLTLRQAWKGQFEGRRIAIVGDIAHSRVARSAIHGECSKTPPKALTKASNSIFDGRSSGSRNGCVACQCFAMSTRRASQTLSCDLT